jgi:hypothetical protein
MGLADEDRFRVRLNEWMEPEISGSGAVRPKQAKAGPGAGCKAHTRRGFQKSSAIHELLSLDSPSG